jgi:hypothetical protein
VTRAAAEVSALDPFDLPEWLGDGPLAWTAHSALHGSAVVSGQLCAGSSSIACDLLCADLAFPEPVLDEQWRRSAHQAWTFGQVLLVEYDGRPTLAVPGTGFTADLVLEALARLAKAIGVPPDRFAATLRL